MNNAQTETCALYKLDLAKLDGEILMKTDSQLKQDVIAELARQPLLKAAEIGVTAKDAVDKETIESALRGNWFVNDIDIHVDVSGHNVTLTGIVRSWNQKDEASETAWKAPGVWNVENDLQVKHDYSMAD